ncbi:hypothetical protein [Streptomyces sp. 7N604]|uniref:hypothetical protein n=1 Tax=Streptomyces sp. 7N604 TaxID=3457415 RepID=UPI003FD6B04F
MLMSFNFAQLAGWTFTPVGLQRLRESLAPLAMSLAAGVGAVAAARAILDLRVRSLWLLLGVPIPVWMALLLAGVIGNGP